MFTCNDIRISCSFSLSRNVHRTEGTVETNEVCLNFCGVLAERKPNVRESIFCCCSQNIDLVTRFRKMSCSKLDKIQSHTYVYWILIADKLHLQIVRPDLQSYLLLKKLLLHVSACKCWLVYILDVCQQSVKIRWWDYDRKACLIPQAHFIEVTEHHEVVIGEISVQVLSFLSIVHMWTLITSFTEQYKG